MFIDTEKIKKMTNERIGYDLFEKEEKLKTMKFKKSMLVASIFAFCIMGTITVNAATDGKVVEEIKNIFTIKVNGDEKNSNCTKNSDGTITCKIDKNVTGDEDIEITVNEENINSIEASRDNETGDFNIDIKE